MKTIYRIIGVILLAYLSPNLIGDDKPKDKSPSSVSNNEISRTEQKMQGLGQLELVIQNGHSRRVDGILITKDERKFISYSLDNTIKIWEMQEGKLLRTLEGHTNGVKGVQFTKDEKKLISYSLDNTIKIWDIDNGRLLKTLEGHKGEVNGIQLTENERKLISCSQDGSIKIWDMATGKLLKTFEAHKGEIYAIQLTKDEKKLISCSWDGTIKIWEMGNGKLHKILEGHKHNVSGIQLTKNEKKLISYARDKTINIWDLENFKLIKTLEGHTDIISGVQLTKDEKKLISYSWDSTIRVWDMKDGKLLKTLTEHYQGVKEIQLTTDEKRLISSSGDSTIKIWDLENFRLLKTLEGHTDGVMGISLTKDEKKLISCSSDTTIKIWDLDNDKLLKTFEGYTLGVEGSQVTQDSNILISYTNNIEYAGYKDYTIRMWNIKEGKLFKTLAGHAAPIFEIQLTKDERKLISYSGSDIKTWDIVSGELLNTLGELAEGTLGIQLTKDEKKLISYSWDNTIKIWDFEKGKLIKTLEGHTNRVKGIQLTKDEKKLISCSSDNTIKIWDFENWKLLKSLEEHSGEINGIQLTKDGKRLISYSWDKTIKIWDLDNGKLLKTWDGNVQINGIKLSKDETKLISYAEGYRLKDNTIKVWNMENGKIVNILEGHTDWVKETQFTKDGKKLISLSADNTIKIWDWENGKLIRSLNQYSSSIQKIVFNESPTNPNILLSISSDGSLRYWNIETGKLLVTQLLFKNGESIYYTPEGYFDFTDKSALEFISFVSPKIQNNFVDLQDLMNDYYVDGLLELVTNNKFKPNKKNNLTKGVETTSVVKALFETQQSVESSEDNKTLSFQITERGAKFEKAIVYVNGIQVDEKTLVDGENTEGVKLEDDSKEGYFKYRVKFAVPLNYGVNRVEVKAYNSYNIPQSFPAFEIQRKIPENKELAKPDLYILSVGVNDYKTKKLTYSVPDAKAMAEVFQQGKSGIYREVHTKLLVDAKKKEIEDAFLEIEKKARPQDVVLVYFSGHGMNAFTREGKKLFYFVPQDFKWPDDPENENVARLQGIDADYLNETFTKIKSHKLILILDSCHSGSVNVALASRGQDKEKATRKAMEKMANGTGRFIFASSSGNEESREHSEVGHGLYTYVLLNALGKNKNIADADSINKDGFIYLSEIRSYIEQQFEEQTAKYLKGVIQTPPSMSLGRNGMHERVNDFPLVKSGK